MQQTVVFRVRAIQSVLSKKAVSQPNVCQTFIIIGLWFGPLSEVGLLRQLSQSRYLVGVLATTLFRFPQETAVPLSV